MAKLLAEMEVVTKANEAAEVELAKLSRSETSNATIIADLKQNLEDETRAKLALQTRLRQAEAEREAAKDSFDEAEQNKQALEKHAQTLQLQVRSCFSPSKAFTPEFSIFLPFTSALCCRWMTSKPR